jgi:uracil-DNA glycosylase
VQYRDLKQEEKLKELTRNVQSCQRCDNAYGKDNILTNIVAKISKSGIGFWSDAYPNFSAKLMIIGQDWGVDGL